MCRYIEQEIRRIPANEISESHAKQFPTVLIIGPKPFLSTIEDYLRTCFSQVQAPVKKEVGLDVLDGYRLLARDDVSNLGWRILIQLLQPTGWEEAVRQGLDSRKSLRTFLGVDFVAEQLNVVVLLRRWLAQGSLSDAEATLLAAAIGTRPDDLAVRIRGPEPEPAPEVDQTAPTIMLTSLMGSKGLQAGHVFIVGVNEGHFPRRNASITNEEVCQLLVALTRARKSCTIVSTGRFGAEAQSASIFLAWLRPHLAATERVDKAYFAQARMPS